MKKLMIAAASAAMISGAFAGVAQVYDMAINLKTTECKKSNKAITDACGTHYFYRAQTSVKLEGKFWGCGCPTIANPIEEQYGQPRLAWVDDWSCDDNSNSYMFWGKSAAFHHVTFAWELLQIVGQKSTDVEGKFNAKFYLCEDGTVAEDETLDLDGAGYGKGKITACGDEDEAYLNQITSMSGSVVGIYDVVDATALVGCPYCGTETECYPYKFCPCVEVLEDKSAAYGTFTLKFNSGLANKIMAGKYIDQAYKFKDFVTAEFACIAAGEDPEDPTVEDKVTENYKACVKAVAAAEADILVASNTTVAAYDTYRQVSGQSYGSLTAWGETKNNWTKRNDAEAIFFTAWNKIVKANTGDTCDAGDDLVDDMLKYNYNDTTPGAWTTFKGYADAYVAAFATWATQRDTVAMSEAQYEAKLISASALEAEKGTLTTLAKTLATAKTDFVKAIAVYEIADKVQQAKDKTAFTALYEGYDAYKTGMSDIAVAYNPAEWTYENAWQYDEKGIALTAAQLTALEKEAKDEYTAAAAVCNVSNPTGKVTGGTAVTALNTAKSDLAQAETACLITKGNKECK